MQRNGLWYAVRRNCVFCIKRAVVSLKGQRDFSYAIFLLTNENQSKMKKLIFLSVLFLSLKCNGQIEQVEVKTIVSPAQTNIAKYDSLDKWYPDPVDRQKYTDQRIYAYYDNVIDSLKQLIGQEIFILPRSKKYTKHYNYEGGYFAGGDPAKTFSSNQNKGFNNGYNYNYFDGKKLKITNVIVHRQCCEFSVKFELLSEEDNQTLYWWFLKDGNGIINHNIPTPLLIVGYFEKLKTIYINRDFIYTKSFGLTDNNSGQTIENMFNSEWKCTKIALADYGDEPYQKITFILNNSMGNQIEVKLDTFKKTFIGKTQYLQEIENKRIQENARIAEEKRLAGEEKKERLAAAKEAETVKDKKIANDKIKQQRREDFIKKYGDKYGAIIADGQVKIGMTKEMCIAAWGNPIEKTKQNSVLEKWGYKSKSIYFDKAGIITAIQ
jgi:hypothetical protein